MSGISIKRYEPSDYAAWNTFIGKAKNATFLFHRDFMEYHSDRFSDFSLLAFEQNTLVSVLPANIVNATVVSHAGLTYGGFVFSENMRLAKAIGIFGAALRYLHENEISTLKLKMIPRIYNHFFSDEIHYALFILGSRLLRRDCLSVMDMNNPFAPSPGRVEGIKKGKKNMLTIREEADLTMFWNAILIPNLNAKHGAQPVHTLDEISFLKSKFPNSIRQFNVYDGGTIVAGTTIFETDNVAHAQYISGNSDKNGLGSVDYLYDFLLTEVFPHKPFFDFGISNENAGNNVNSGLLFWKESFGAKTVTQDFYEVDTAGFAALENVML